MPLQTGTRVGPYEIVAPIGSGGMGEVYRARDAKLNRDVAIKVLPDVSGGDPERIARFEREAQLLASLNHPNIAAIYGVEEVAGNPALILELVEGQTLADRLTVGPMPIDEALAVTRQIADALETAHAHGVIHRDLKPANVKLRPDGTVKVLDFGLAKAFGPAGGSADPVNSPTFTAATQAGVILGTAAYMAPEQARGRPVDKRADVWAFGCVLYECLTGRPAFGGETASDIVAAILTRDVDIGALPAATPRAVRELIRRCLQRDPKRRLHDVADARIEIDEALERPDEAPSTPMGAPPRARTSLVPWLVVAGLAVAVGALGWQRVRSPANHAARVARVSVNLPAGIALGDTQWPLIAVSPDGTRIVIVGMADDVSQLYLRRLDRDELTPLAGTRGATRPFFSPDGRWVGFTAAKRLKKIALEGGLVVDLCPAAWGGGAWGRDGRILFTQDYNTGLWSVPEGGGPPRVVTEPDKNANELGHWWPQILPDGDTVIFTSLGTPIETSRILARSLKTGEQKLVMRGAVGGRATDSGHLLFARVETVLAAPFDAARAEITGPAVPVAEGVLFAPQNATSQFAVSDAGLLAVIRTTAVSTTQRLVAIDRAGGVQVVRDGLKTYGAMQLSPDGRRVALSLMDGSKPPDVWVHDLDRDSLSRVTFGPASNFNPVWTPDGRRIIYTSERPVFDLYVKPADASSAETPISRSTRDQYANAVSPDGQWLLATVSTVGATDDLWIYPLAGGGEPRAVLSTPAADTAGAFSPDGRWLAYSSDESDPGVGFEVYVRSFPSGATRFQVSTDGGSEPVWAPSGRELFYRRGRQFMSVSIDPDGRPGRPVRLFELDLKICGAADQRSACYDVSPDGQRFYALQPAEPVRPQPSFDLTLNLFDELKRIAH